MKKNVIIDLKHISVKLGDNQVLDDLSLYIRDREFITLLGPSGCGKTTILRVIAGFLEPDEGDVIFEDKKINGVPPHKRQVNTIFQRYALFPHLNVYENIAFGMRLKGKKEDEIQKTVTEMLHMVNLNGMAHRGVGQLSGGQQQRVAIARTLAPEPQVLFMDEPLSNLDAKLRLEMRYELQRLHLETGSTFVYVTHDQMEAMTLATKICLINNGVLQQYDAPLEVYNRPTNLFAADFVGNPSINFVEATGEQSADGSVALEIFHGIHARFIPNEALELSSWFTQRDADAAAKKQAEIDRLKQKHAVEKSNKDEVFKYHIEKVVEEDSSILEDPVLTNRDLVLGIRPEAIDIELDGALQTTIFGAMPTGMESTLKLCVQDDYLLTGVIFGNNAYRIGEQAGIDIHGSHILLFDRQSGKCIADGRLEIEK